VLRWDDRIGSLERGKLADLVMLDGKAPHLMATQDLPTELIRFGTRAEVRQVMVNGRLLFDNGTFETIDLDRLCAEAAAGAAHVRTVTVGRRYKPLNASTDRTRAARRPSGKRAAGPS
jgi:cytosine/adenosine deaminase-related metal-dependent hydrolase